MCGIVGQVNFSESNKIDEKLLIQMRDTLNHRGPDDAGIYIYKNVGIAFRRLSIIDLSKNGAQPMSNEDQTVWLVFNGEFYNFLDYREALIKKGHKFKSYSDSEVIIHLYEEYGIECIKKINGMFAFAIYDKNKNKLFLVRDRFGVKPLFYYIDNNRMIFASELKAIIKNNKISKELNLNSLATYFSVGYILPPESIFLKIKKVELAEYLCFDLEKNKIIKKEKYWSLRNNINNNHSFSEWQEKFEKEYKQAIKRRLISDVPLGVFLSGGIDSSSVVAFMSEFSKEKIKTFSIGMRESGYDESKYSRQVAKQFNTDHHELIVKPNVIDLLPKLTYYYDEPFDDSSALPTFYLSKFIKENVTVAISGDGGDELLAGYNHYQNYNRYNIVLALVPQFFRSTIFGLAYRLCFDSKNKRRFYLLSLPIYKSFHESVAGSKRITPNLFIPPSSTTV
jgi:asparagine synthase (glutamine-hydrolysing)